MPDLPIRGSAGPRRTTKKAPDLGDPPIARLGSSVGMPEAIFNEDDDVTLADLARIGRPAVPQRRRTQGTSRR